MANASFTRDEVILTLDVLYSAKNNQISPNSQEMKELSTLLNRLPIHPSKQKKANFRTASGITKQVKLFLSSCRLGEKNPHVGKLFFDVAFEYEGRMDELHCVAEAIRRNENYYVNLFGDSIENHGFPEGALLGHLHYILEKQAEGSYQKDKRCAICNIQPNLHYQIDTDLLQLHLFVSPEELDGKKKYGEEFYITVCPTCHTALHRIRPWKKKNDYGEIFR